MYTWAPHFLKPILSHSRSTLLLRGEKVWLWQIRADDGSSWMNLPSCLADACQRKILLNTRKEADLMAEIPSSKNAALCEHKLHNHRQPCV